MRIKKRKGVSPVIATVLLIAIVVVMGVIVFVWFNQISQEAITKFGGENIQLVCGDVSFDSSYNSGVLSIVNNGNVPIYGMKIKIVSQGSYETQDLGGKSGIADSWPDTGLNQGGAFSENLNSYIGSAQDIVLIPVLIGSSESGERTYVCDEDQYGREIAVA